jgi:hypothetical protein
MQTTWKQCRARKPYWCCECDGPIEVSELHHASDQIHYGEKSRCCMTCWGRETAWRAA